MTRAFYYATNTRMFKDIMQYILHPVVRMGAYTALRSGKLGKFSPEEALDGADIVASLAGGVVYNINTATFQAKEAQFLDRNARTAVAAELGLDPNKLKFSDYLDSQNAIVHKELEDAKHVNKWRYATDALFFIPAAIYAAAHLSHSEKFVEGYRMGRWNRTKPKDGMGLPSMAIGAFNLWDTGIYGTKAAYWMYETYRVNKSAHYEIVKLDETIEATGKKFDANDLIAVVNRSREDRGLSQIQEKDEREALWPLLELLAERMNTSENFGMPELMYLSGLNKVNIFELDQQGNEVHDENGERIISQYSIEKSREEIERVAEKGLVQISEEVAAAKKAQAEKYVTGFTDVSTQVGGTVSQSRYKTPTQSERNHADWAYQTTSNVRSFVLRLFGGPTQTTDHISPREGITTKTV